MQTDNQVKPDARTECDSTGSRPAQCSANIVCLCGSSRWPELHHKVMMDETLAGNIVIPMGLYGHADYPTGARAATNDGDESTAVKQMLDRLHFQKINLANEIIVVTKDGYIGDSTRREIAHAEATGKRVRYWPNDELENVQIKCAEWQNTAQRLEMALKKIIEMNRQHAKDQYGDPNKAESWACIKVARKALAEPSNDKVGNSGTASANGGWLRRLIRHQRHN